MISRHIHFKKFLNKKFSLSYDTYTCEKGKSLYIYMYVIRNRKKFNDIFAYHQKNKHSEYKEENTEVSYL